MAFTNTNLGEIGHSAGYSLFRYVETGATLATIIADDYMLAAYQRLGAQDLILVTGSDNTALMRVTASSSTTVTLTSGQDIGGLITVPAQIADVSTASSAWAVSPVAGTVVAIYSVISGTIASADAVLDPQIGGTSITGGGITITASGSAAGNVDSATPTAANTVTAGGAIEVATSGASTNTVICNVYFVIKQTL